MPGANQHLQVPGGGGGDTWRCLHVVTANPIQSHGNNVVSSNERLIFQKRLSVLQRSHYTSREICRALWHV